MAFLYVFIGGGIGSILRYGLSRLIPYETGFPTATFVANMVSSFILGAFLGWAWQGTLSKENQWLLITGLCGGFSTFSTFSAENYLLWKEGDYVTLSIYLLASIIGGILAIFIGIKVTNG